MEITFKTSGTSILSEILDSPIIPALIAIVATAMGFIIKEFLDSRRQRRRDRERILLECIKLTELRLQKIIEKSIGDLWFDFHQRMFDLTYNNHDKERALEYLQKTSKISMDLHDINADLIKNKTEFQLKSRLNGDEVNQLDTLMEGIINFSGRHNYHFPNMTQQQMIQLSNQLHIDIGQSINLLRPRMIEARTSLLNFMRPRL